MKDLELLNRIEIDKEVLHGKPVIKGTRLAVDFILNLLAHDMTKEEILNEYRDLNREDILACLLFAKEAMENTEFFPSSFKVS
ncbi:MAG: DUF433 domain-containing protein [Spirochaetia bacterium]